jgi:hypothetical protein
MMRQILRFGHFLLKLVQNIGGVHSIQVQVQESKYGKKLEMKFLIGNVAIAAVFRKSFK